MHNEYDIILEFINSNTDRRNQMDTEPRKFWMITGDGNSPKVRHYNLKEARMEAERLASANPGTEFFVLQSTEMVQHAGIIHHKF